MAPPFAINNTIPAPSDLISAYPLVETTFRSVVLEWLTFISSPTTGKIKTAQLDAAAFMVTFLGTANASAARTALGVDQSFVLGQLTGSIALARRTGTQALNFLDIVDGSQLVRTNAAGTTTGTALSGSFYCLGSIAASATGAAATTLFMRVP